MTTYVELEVKIHWEIEEAYLVSTDGVKDNAVWVNKDKIEHIDEGEKAYALITVPQYYAEFKELV